MTVEVSGEEFKDVLIPYGPNGPKDKLRSGDTFEYRYSKGDIDRVLATTMSQIACTKVIMQKPVIYANFSHAFVCVTGN